MRLVPDSAFGILTYGSPQQLNLAIEGIMNAHTDYIGCVGCQARFCVDNSTEKIHQNANAEVCEKWFFTHVPAGENTGISGGRVLLASQFLAATRVNWLITQGDGPLWCAPGSDPDRYGFPRHVEGLIGKALCIAETEGLDYLKLTWCEKHGTNAHYYAYRELRGDERSRDFPEIYQGTPPTQIERIATMDGLPYAIGNFPYSNWPAIWSRRFAQEFIANTPKADEQSWMRCLHRDQLKRKWRVGCLLASPVEYHHRFDYDRSQRREN